MTDIDYASLVPAEEYDAQHANAEADTAVAEPEEPTTQETTTEEEPSSPEAESKSEDDAQAAPAAEEKTEDLPAPDYSSLYSELNVDSVDTLKSRLQEAETLKAELEQLKNAPKPELEFESEGAKKLYEYASKFSGMEMDKAREFLHIQSLDVTKLSPQDALWEDFLLDEDNGDLSREEARQLFELRYADAFDEDADPLRKRDAIVQANKARRRLQEKQADFSATPKSSDAKQPTQQEEAQVSEAQKAEIKQEFDKVFSGYNTFKVQTDKDNAFELKIESSDAKAIRQLAEDVNSYAMQVAEKSSTENGFSYQEWTNHWAKIVLFDKAVNHARSEGYAAGKESVLKEIKNPPSTKPNLNPTPKDDKQTLYDNMLAAFGKK